MAKFNFVAGMKRMHFDAFAIDISAIGAGEILDIGGLKIGHDFGVMRAYSFILEIDVVVRGTANKYRPGGEINVSLAWIV